MTPPHTHDVVVVGASIAGSATATLFARAGARVALVERNPDLDAYKVELSAPITRQGWRLEGGPGGARLEGLEGGTRVGADATVLLREATGWEIPVAALASWVRGARDPEGGTATLQFGADGRLARMQQDGWQLAYGEWVASPGLGIDLPTRIEAERGEARVRLVVDGWSADAR